MSSSGRADQSRILYLLRHGRTDLNAAGQLRGRIDVPLDEVGVAEAVRLAELFSSADVRAVVSSPLQRAVTTAQSVADRHGLTVETDIGLSDRDWGPWSGHLAGEVEARFGSIDDAPGIEPFDDFLGRIIEPLAGLVSGLARGPIVVVAHKAVNRALLARLVPDCLDRRSIPQPTGCWNLLLRSHEPVWMAPVVGAVPGDGNHPGVKG